MGREWFTVFISALNIWEKNISERVMISTGQVRNAAVTLEYASSILVKEEYILKEDSYVRSYGLYPLNEQVYFCSSEWPNNAQSLLYNHEELYLWVPF